jgi:hypothetical protein
LQTKKIPEIKANVETALKSRYENASTMVDVKEGVVTPFRRTYPMLSKAKRESTAAAVKV